MQVGSFKCGWDMNWFMCLEQECENYISGAGMIENSDVTDFEIEYILSRNYNTIWNPLATTFENDNCTGKSYTIN